MKKILAVAVLAVVVAFGYAVASSTVTEHSFSIPNGGGIEKIDGVHLTNVTWNGSAVTLATQAVVTNITPSYVTNIITYLDASTNAVASTNILTTYAVQTKTVTVVQ